MSDFDTKVVKIRSEMHQERREQDNLMASTLSKVTDELSMIQGELFAERKAREESYEVIIKKLGGQILKLNETISQERSVKNPFPSYRSIARGLSYLL